MRSLLPDGPELRGRAIVLELIVSAHSWPSSSYSLPRNESFPSISSTYPSCTELQICVSPLRSNANDHGSEMPHRLRRFSFGSLYCGQNVSNVNWVFSIIPNGNTSRRCFSWVFTLMFLVIVSARFFAFGPGGTYRTLMSCTLQVE